MKRRADDIRSELEREARHEPTCEFEPYHALLRSQRLSLGHNRAMLISASDAADRDDYDRHRLDE